MKYLLLLFFVPFFFQSCSEEGCKNTESPEKTFTCLFNIVVTTSDDGSFLNDVPVEVTCQKWWCEGDYAAVIRYSGYTKDAGYYRKETGFSYVLENDLDYIRVVAYVGENKIEYARDIYYPEINVTSKGKFIVDIYHTQ